MLAVNSRLYTTDSWHSLTGTLRLGALISCRHDSEVDVVASHCMMNPLSRTVSAPMLHSEKKGSTVTEPVQSVEAEMISRLAC